MCLVKRNSRSKVATKMFAKMIVSNGELMKHDLKYVCAAAIAFLRKEYNLVKIWNKEL